MFTHRAQANAALKISAAADGFSYTSEGVQPTKGYAVALANQPVFRVTGFSRKDSGSVVRALGAWIKANKDAFGTDSLLGGWYDKDADVYEVEPSRLVTNKREAIKLAKANNQIAIFNLGTFEEISTGGDGNR